MKTTTLVLLLCAGLSKFSSAQAPVYPPLRDYLMSEKQESALAESAAPASITDHATIKVLSPSGFRIARQGQNGFTCLVMRGWSAPTYTPAQFRDFVYDAKIRAPICFNPAATQSVLPYYELRSQLGMAGRTPAQIAESVKEAYSTGKLPKRQASLAYMWSADQNLGQGIGHWHPHVMIFAPGYTNDMVGGNAFGSVLPQLSDDAGTPFAVVVIPVDQSLAIKGNGARQ